MAEGHHSPSTTTDHQNITVNETKPNNNQNKKNDSQKENSLYIEPLPKCYIGIGNNPEL